MTDDKAARQIFGLELQAMLLHEFAQELDRGNVSSSVLAQFTNPVWRKKFFKDVVALMAGRNRLLNSSELRAAEEMKELAQHIRTSREGLRNLE